MLYPSRIVSKLDQEIISLLVELNQHKSDSEEYGAILDRMVKLQKMKSDERLKLPSLDTVLVVGANIFGILWLARYEKENVVKAKVALGFVMKPR